MARNFLTLEDATREELRAVLELARSHARGAAGTPLAGKTVCLAFYESSTRTAVSFELAARRCGADVISLSEGGSAISKGESLVDTVVTLDSLGADALVLRHPATGAATLAARHTDAAVVNAGDGCGQHPTQALLDLYALSEAKGGFEELAGSRALRAALVAPGTAEAGRARIDALLRGWDDEAAAFQRSSQPYWLYPP